MDFVQAKSILDKFANTYRAAEFMAEALETAASLERRGQELQNNVEHLMKEQVAQQQALDAMLAEFSRSQAQAQQTQAAKMVAMRNESDRVFATLEGTRRNIEEGITVAQARLDDLTHRGNTISADLDARIRSKQDELTALQTQIEALRAQARSVLN